MNSLARSSRGLGHHPLKVAARVRIPYGLRKQSVARGTLWGGSVGPTLGSSNASVERQRFVGSKVSVQPNFGLEGRQAMTVSASHGVGRGLLDIIAYLVSVV